jgi:hypothetical protein
MNEEMNKEMNEEEIKQNINICETNDIISGLNIELDKTYEHTITEYKFDNLPDSKMIEIFKDGRAFSHFIEPWLAEKYPLNHVTGCKKYDHIDKNDSSILYDQKTFTSRGCKYYPSNMIGEGRKFDKDIFEEKAKKLIYIIVSNIHFPKIKIKFVKGIELIKQYPKGEINLKEFDKFFK